MKSSFLLPVLLLQFICANANPEPIITTQYAEVYGYQTYKAKTYSDTTYTPVLTYYKLVTPTDVPSNGLLTHTGSVWNDPDVTVIEIYLPKPTTASTTRQRTKATRTFQYYDYTPTSTISTSYVLPLTYTPFKSCLQTWTHITTISVMNYYPTVKNPVIISTIFETQTYWDESEPTTRTVHVGLLGSTDVPKSILESSSAIYEPSGMSYCYVPTAICSTPTATATGGSAVEPSCTTTFSWDKNVKYPGLVSGPGSSTDVGPDSLNNKPAGSSPEQTTTVAVLEAAKSSAMKCDVVGLWWTAMVSIVGLFVLFELLFGPLSFWRPSK